MYSWYTPTIYAIMHGATCPHVITWTNVDKTFLRYEALFSIQNIEAFFQKINTFLCGLKITKEINPTYEKLSFKFGL